MGYPTGCGASMRNSRLICQMQHKPCSKPSGAKSIRLSLLKWGIISAAAHRGIAPSFYRNWLQQGASGYVVIVYDPEGVQSCIQAGVGGDVSLQVGGKVDNLHGDPVAIRGTVRLIHDGQYIETEPRHGGTAIPQPRVNDSCCGWGFFSCAHE